MVKSPALRGAFHFPGQPEMQPINVLFTIIPFVLGPVI